MGFIITASGRKFYPLAPDPDHIIVEDVAHHLAKIARWTGATKGDDATYSVAQHAVYVSHMCAPKDALWGLHHDDSEALHGRHCSAGKAFARVRCLSHS